MKTGSSQSLQKIQSWETSWQQLASAWAQTSNFQRALPTSASGSGLDRVRRAEYSPHFWAGRISTTLSRRLIPRSEEHTSELQSLTNIVCRLLLEKKNSIQHK